MDKIEWIVPNFSQYFGNENTTQLYLLTAEEVHGDKPTLDFKIQFSGFMNNICDILFMSKNFDTLTYKLSIYFGNFNQRIQRAKENLKVQKNKWNYITTLYERDDKSKLLLLNGSLKLKFEYEFLTVMNCDSHVPHCDNQLCDEFKRLLSDEQFSDIVTIKSVEGNEYKVHKAVLQNKSKVMRAHFEHNTTESKTRIVESPLEDEVLKDILTFIYYNNAPSLKDMPEKLLAAADYYQLSQLKSLCENALSDKLCVENAIDTLLIADLYSAEILKKSTLEFMKDEATLVVKTKVWAKLNSTELLKAFCVNTLNCNVEFIKPFI